MEKFKKIFIIFLIFIIGVYLIYFIASRFFKTSEEISFEPKEGPGTVQETDYLAPNFELTNIEGKRVRLFDYKNKIIILSFWTTWNPAAQDQLVILESYYQEIKDNKDLVLLTINNQEDKSVASNFISRGGYTLPVLLDEKGEIGELYRIKTLPATYFINQEGKVKEIYIGILNKEEINRKVEGLY